MDTGLGNELLGAGAAFEGLRFMGFLGSIQKTSASGTTGDPNSALGGSQVFGLLGLFSQGRSDGYSAEMYNIHSGRVKLFLGIIQHHASTHEIGFV